MGSWPYRWAVSTSGPTLAKRRSRRRGFCCTILLRCGKGRGLPGPLVPLYCPGGFGRGKPLPYTQQRKKFGNVQGLFAPGPRQLGTVAGQGKALGVEAGTNRGADITHRMQRHLCDPTRLRAEPRTMHLPPSTAGWIPQGGGRPRLWWVFGNFLPSQKVTPAERPCQAGKPERCRLEEQPLAQGSLWAWQKPLLSTLGQREGASFIELWTKTQWSGDAWGWQRTPGAGSPPGCVRRP